MQGMVDLFGPPPGGSAPSCEGAPEAPARALRAEIARLSQPVTAWGAVPFGDRRIDARFPSGGLARGAWHEIVGAGGEREAPAAAAGFAASLAQMMARGGVLVWALQRDDAHAPGLAALGFDPDRVIFVRAGNDAETLAVCEDALRTRGVDCVIGETASLSLIAGKRLQLACESGGASAFLLRRYLHGTPRKPPRVDASAAATRWAIASAPSETDEPGLGAPRWRVNLQRCRGGRAGAWIVEHDDATRTLRVAAELVDHAAETASGQSLRAWPGGAGAGEAGRQRQAAVRGR